MQTGDSSYSSKDQLTKRAIYNIIKTFGSKVILTLIWQCLEEFQFYPIDAESYHTWIILYFQKYSKMEAWTSKPDQQLLDTTNVTRIALKRLNKVIILTCILVWWALTRFMLLEMSPNVWIIVIYICISLLIEYKNNKKFKIISCEQINFQYVNYWLYL